MSGPVVVDQQPAQDQDLEPAPKPDQAPATQPLPGDIDLDISMLEDSAHDAKLLAQLIQRYPQYRDAIVSAAGKQLGNTTINDALAIVDGTAPPEFDWVSSPLAAEGGSLADRARANVQYIQAHPELRETMLAQIAKFEPDLADAVRDGLDNPTPIEDQPAPAPAAVDAAIDQQQQPQAPQPEVEPGWVAAARAYNAQHTANVDELIGLAGLSLVDAQGVIDPVEVAKLQDSLGVEADGKVGPATLSAAHDRFKTTTAEQVDSEQVELPDDDLRKSAE
jgi:hypothetical protein